MTDYVLPSSMPTSDSSSFVGSEDGLESSDTQDSSSSEPISSDSSDVDISSGENLKIF